jgi:hypothetical protein
MHTLPNPAAITLRHVRLRALLTRYRAAIYAGLLLLSIALAFAGRHGGAAPPPAAGASSAATDDRPLLLPDR